MLDRFPSLAHVEPDPDPGMLPAHVPKTRDQISSDFLSKLRFFKEGEAAAQQTA